MLGVAGWENSRKGDDEIIYRFVGHKIDILTAEHYQNRNLIYNVIYNPNSLEIFKKQMKLTSQLSSPLNQKIPIISNPTSIPIHNHHSQTKQSAKPPKPKPYTYTFLTQPSTTQTNQNQPTLPQSPPLIPTRPHSSIPATSRKNSNIYHSQIINHIPPTTTTTTNALTNKITKPLSQQIPSYQTINTYPQQQIKTTSS
jgi:hypothetical protein